MAPLLCDNMTLAVSPITKSTTGFTGAPSSLVNKSTVLTLTWWWEVSVNYHTDWLHTSSSLPSSQIRELWHKDLSRFLLHLAKDATTALSHQYLTFILPTSLETLSSSFLRSRLVLGRCWSRRSFSSCRQRFCATCVHVHFVPRW